MRWSGATGAIARCKRVSTGCGRKRRSARVWRWICGVKPTPKAGNKPWQHFIVHGLAKPGSSATVSYFGGFLANQMWDEIFNHEQVRNYPSLVNLLKDNFDFESVYKPTVCLAFDPCCIT